jgi:hypothetical protein
MDKAQKYSDSTQLQYISGTKLDPEVTIPF